jgi:hypothetical protein
MTKVGWWEKIREASDRYRPRCLREARDDGGGESREGGRKTPSEQNKQIMDNRSPSDGPFPAPAGCAGMPGVGKHAPSAAYISSPGRHSQGYFSLASHPSMQRFLDQPRQDPTHPCLHIRTAKEALLVIYATYLGHLPKITQRLSLAERQRLQSGCVYVSERDMSKSAAGERQLKRFTDGLKWSQSKNRDVCSFDTL